MAVEIIHKNKKYYPGHTIKHPAGEKLEMTLTVPGLAKDQVIDVDCKPTLKDGGSFKVDDDNLSADTGDTTASIESTGKLKKSASGPIKVTAGVAPPYNFTLEVTGTDDTDEEEDDQDKETEKDKPNGRMDRNTLEYKKSRNKWIFFVILLLIVPPIPCLYMVTCNLTQPKEVNETSPAAEQAGTSTNEEKPALKRVKSNNGSPNETFDATVPVFIKRDGTCVQIWVKEQDQKKIADPTCKNTPAAD